MGPKGDPKATLGTWGDPTGAHGDPKGAQGVIFINFWIISGDKKGPKNCQNSYYFSMFFWMHFGNVFDCFLGPFWYPFGIVFGPRRSKNRKGAMSIFGYKTLWFLIILSPKGGTDIAKVKKKAYQKLWKIRVDFGSTFGTFWLPKWSKHASTKWYIDRTKT